MKSRYIAVAIMACAIVAITYLLLDDAAKESPSLKVGIAPFQDMAMLVNARPLGLEEKYGVDIELFTMNWSELTPAVASRTGGVDVAFASLLQFISQSKNLNSNTDDPIVFFAPGYVFKGGGFVSFNDNVPALGEMDIDNTQLVKRFFEHKIAVQKSSSFEILLFDLASRNGVNYQSLDIVDIGAEEGLLAAINGAVDVTSVGLTQKNEALKRGGQVVLEMEDLGQVDIAGFIAKRSTLTEKKGQIEALIRMWFESIDFVFENPSENSSYSLKYLRENSSTNYTFEEYMRALDQEILPRSYKEMLQLVQGSEAPYRFDGIIDRATQFYVHRGSLEKRPEHIEIMEIKD